MKQEFLVLLPDYVAEMIMMRSHYAQRARAPSQARGAPMADEEV
jgi:hypothetical protein